MLAYISSPHSGVIHAGHVFGRQITIHMYGLMLLAGIAACIVVTGIRWVRQGGDWDLIFRVAVWGVAFGIVGARAYHVATSWSEVNHKHWWGVFAVWEGGLGVWGGIFLGVLAGAVVVKLSGESVFRFMDAVAPGLLIAQGIGRWGNWWNQELYGKPTTHSWGLKIDIAHQSSIPAKYQGAVAYHPTFLYEFAYDTAAALVLILIGWRFRIRPPALFALYVSLYTVGRFFEELLRIDPSHHFYGLRLNAWVSIVLFALSTLFFVYWQFFHRAPDPAAPGSRRRRDPVVLGPTMAIPKKRGR
jgi:prolipoprotein diacylglyceryl transferase